MCIRLVAAGSLLLALGSVALPSELGAQAAGAPVPALEAELPAPADGARLAPTGYRSASFAIPQRSARSRTGTGLLVGALVGVAATTAFLVPFCSDPDTSCGGDEVGRAAVLIAVPSAALGALIGSLVRTDE